MTPDGLGATLLNATEAELPFLLEQATDVPECSAWLLSHAGSSLPSNPDIALKAGQISERLAILIKDQILQARCLRVMAQAYRCIGKHETAIESLTTSAHLARVGGNALLAAQVQIGKIDSLAWLGRHEEAYALSNTLATRFRSLGSPLDSAKVLANVGNVYFRQDRHHQALNCYQDAATAFSDAGDPIAAAKIDFNRANIHSELLQPELALSLFSSARETFASHDLSTASAMCDFNIGILYQGGGQYSAALASQQRARTVFTSLEQPIETAKCDADMGDVYRLLNLRSEALASYNAAIATFETVPLEYEIGRAELGRASILHAEHDDASAGAAIERAESIFKRQNNSAQLAQAHLLRAYWLRASGELIAAQREARRSAEVYKKLKLPAREAEAKYLDVEISYEVGGDVSRHMAAIKRTAKKYALGWLETRCNRSLGNYAVRQKNVSGALNYFRAAVAALESTRTTVPGEELHTAFISDKLGIYEDIVSVLLDRGRVNDLIEALEYVERSKSRLLLEKVQAALAPEAVNNKAVSGISAARVNDLRAQLNRLYSQIHPDDADGSARLVGAPKDQSKLLSELEAAYRAALRSAEIENGPSLFSMLDVASPDELQLRLSSDETLIEYYVVHGTICAFVVSKFKPIKVFRNIGSTDAVEHQARRLRYHLKRAGSDHGYVESHASQFLCGVRKPLASLFDMLLKPLLSAVTGNHLTIVPHGVLHGLPFHAFYDQEHETYVVDNWEIAYTPSANVRHLNASIDGSADYSLRTQSRNALVMGVPDEGLGQIEIECEELAKVLPNAKVYCGNTATLAKFYEHAADSSMIHLATHALFRADNPLFSGLHFSDGWLLARDLYSMRLHCELVTLSACRTGQAQVETGDEMFGLLRGFLAAGVRAVAVSLWPAEDSPTASLMTRFHALMAEGQSRTTALRLAQLHVRNTWPHPYQWAAFALFGER